MNNLNLYEDSLHKDLTKWHKDMQKSPSYLNRMTKTLQTKTQTLIPAKIQTALTQAIKSVTQSNMVGSAVLTNSKQSDPLSLAESDFLIEKAYKTYNKVAVTQGIGFGAGGILLGLADFPALLSIKFKFLFECASIYGYDINDKNERLYLIYVFQLAFSSDKYRLAIYQILMNWDSTTNAEKEINWETFQTEYRDYIDIAKLLQLLPVVGAVFGGMANFKLLEKLKITAMNCYRNRRLS